MTRKLSSIASAIFSVVGLGVSASVLAGLLWLVGSTLLAAL